MATSLLRLDANLSWLFTEAPFEERFELAAAAGFEAVEFATPYDYDPVFLRKSLDDAGLRQILINSPAGPPGSPERSGTACIPQRVEEFRRGFLSALEYAEALGAGIIHLMGGIRPPDTSQEEAFATYVDNVEWAVGQAESTDAVVVLEAINRRDAPGFVLKSLEQAASVVRDLESSSLRLLFDVYHCQVGQGDITTRLQELMPLVTHIQIADGPSRTEPGTGEIAWGFVFDQIRALGYSGWIGCEYRPVGDTVGGLGWRDEFC